MKDSNGQHGKIALKVQKWHSHIGCHQSCLVRLEATQQEGNHGWYYKFRQLPRATEAWILEENLLLTLDYFLHSKLFPYIHRQV